MKLKSISWNGCRSGTQKTTYFVHAPRLSSSATANDQTFCSSGNVHGWKLLCQPTPCTIGRPLHRSVTECRCSGTERRAETMDDGVQRSPVDLGGRLAGGHHQVAVAIPRSAPVRQDSRGNSKQPVQVGHPPSPP